MGYGGDLIWTGVLKALHEESGQPITIAHKPKLTDILSGRLYNASFSLSNSTIFKNNPRVRFNEARPRNRILRALDFAFSAFLKPSPLKVAFETYIFNLAEGRWRNGRERIIHTDMIIHSYADKQLSDRLIWKDGGHATQVIARRFTDRIPEPTCELYFDDAEQATVKRLLFDNEICGPFIALDNGTNRDWFGDLRSWPTARWQETVANLRVKHPDIPIIQIGVPETPSLSGTCDLRGKTSFREAALVIRESSLFIGTESGPMHAARAVGTPSVILWGGVTMPEFAGYPDYHQVLCTYVECAPCGQLGSCNNARICMYSISTDDVVKAVRDIIERWNLK